MSTALLDGDIIAYKGCILNDSNAGTLDDLERLIQNITKDWVSRAECDGSPPIVCLSGRSFRYDVLPTYKANRKDAPRPKDLETSKAMLKEHFRVVQMSRLEADDVMGILATNGKVKDPVIVTTDKDLRCVPGVHCNPDKDEKIVEVDAYEAEVNFCFQWLKGDPTDNVKGCPKVGEVKALKLLNDVKVGECYHSVVLGEYKRRGCTYEFALQQARAVRILTADLWDSETKTPRLWEPSTKGAYTDNLSQQLFQSIQEMSPAGIAQAMQNGYCWDARTRRWVKLTPLTPVPF